jgi:hypothetical protein
VKDLQAGRGCGWTFGPDALTIAPGPGRAPKLLAELGEWHAPEGASGSMRLKVRGRRMPLDPDKDPASVVFSLGYGATHQSLPVAAAVLAALGSSGGSGTPEAIKASRPPEAPAAPRWNEVTELIARLGELGHAGVLSEEEFQAKKTELLSRL